MEKKTTVEKAVELISSLEGFKYKAYHFNLIFFLQRYYHDDNNSLMNNALIY